MFLDVSVVVTRYFTDVFPNNISRLITRILNTIAEWWVTAKTTYYAPKLVKIVIVKVVN